MFTRLVYAYFNNLSTNPEYLYNDSYLLVFKDQDKYCIYESDNKFNYDSTKFDVIDENELSDMVNDTCCGEKVYTLVYENQNFDHDKLLNFIKNVYSKAFERKKFSDC
jgi:hypothetical protein